MDTESQQAILLALYNENCENSRHHQVQRERITSIVAQTAGVMLGLIGFGTLSKLEIAPLHLVIPVFLILLGLWGFAASWKHNERSSLHRARIHEIRKRLSDLSNINLLEINVAADAAHAREFGANVAWETKTHIIWKLFNLLVGAVGLALLIYMIVQLK